ncbi:hypothetical protein I542_4392 [Mycobacteroides abscessus 1948]|uniref:Uncharacterized protein n=1 Tax=Mycobacteroides abscessus 1948 TaxID=1299323 RepID=A0A829QLV7_9MYCO|nr:hypothetical protein I542_4392 [Mycobacteroides abscessus 1948]
MGLQQEYPPAPTKGSRCTGSLPGVPCRARRHTFLAAAV